MRNFTAISLLAICSSAFAQVPGQVFPTEQSAAGEACFFTRENPNKLLFQKAPMREYAEEPIFETPEGTEVYYSLQASGYSNDYGYVMQSMHGLAATMVYCDNGDVYIKDPASFLQIGSYIKGYVEGNEIVVPLPQPIAYFTSPDGGGVAYLNKMYKEGSDWNAWFYTVEEDENEARYIIDGDKITLDLGQSYQGANDYIIGVTFDNEPGSSDSWSGYGDYDQVYTEFHGQVDKPADLSVMQDNWIVCSDGAGNFIQVGVCDNDIYVHGVSNYLHGEDEDWFKGTIDGNKCTFASHQYVGIYPGSGFMYVTFADAVKTVSEWGTWFEFTPLDEVVAEYDAAKKTITFPEGTALVYTFDADYFAYLESMPDVGIKYQDPSIAPAAPQKPEFSYISEYNPMWGTGSLEFDLPMFDVNGNLLDHARMFYNVFVDGLPFYFAPEEYTCFDEDIYDIPYDYSDYYSYLVTGGPFVSHGFTYFFMGAESIAIQSCYLCQDGQVLRSEKAVHYFTTSAIEDINEETDAVAIEIYTLSGVKVENPTNGLYIKKMTFSDGTVKTSKQYIR